MPWITAYETKNNGDCLSERRPACPTKGLGCLRPDGFGDVGVEEKIKFDFLNRIKVNII